jgi:hypothetical protein
MCDERTNPRIFDDDGEANPPDSTILYITIPHQENEMWREAHDAERAGMDNVSYRVLLVRGERSDSWS